MTETEYCAAQLDKIRAETRYILAQAVREEQEAVIAGIDRQERELEQIRALSEINTYHFRADFNEESVNECLDTIHDWHNLDPNGDWRIVLNSPGGNVNEGFHLFDDLEAFSIRGGGTHDITIIVRGMAASMGGILLQAADHRVMGPRASLLIHPMSSWFGGTRGHNHDYMEWTEFLTAHVFDIFRDRGSIPKKTLAAALERKDLWIPAEQALTWKLVDRIG